MLEEKEHLEHRRSELVVDAEALADAGDVRKDIEGALRKTACDSVDGVESGHDEIATPFELGDHRCDRNGALRGLDRMRRAELVVCRDAREVVDVEVPEDRRLLRSREDGPADAPARPGVTLRHAGDEDGPLLHALDRGDRM